MANKAVIPIEVDASAFEKFVEQFKAYTALVEEHPQAWDEINKTLTQHAKEAKRVAEFVNVSDVNMRSMAQSSRYVGDNFKRIAEHAGSAARFVAGLAGSALRIGTLGLIGGGGMLFGLDVLANGVLGQQRSARGMGLSIGEMQSFTTHMRQFASGRTLESAAQAQISPDAAGNLAALGIGFAQAGKMSAGELAIREMQAIRRAWQSNPTTFNPAVAAAQQLGFSLPEIRNIGTAPEAEFQSAVSGYRGDKSRLGFSEQVAQQWAKLSIALERAGVVIESALVRTLAPLAPKFEQMAIGVANWIEAFSHSETVAKLIDGMKEAFDSFVKFITGPGFQADLDAFRVSFHEISDDFSSLSAWIKTVAGYFRGNPDDENAFEQEMGGGKVDPNNPISRGWEKLKTFFSGSKYHNPGNIRHQNALGFWEVNQYPSDSAGISAMGELLRSYPKKHHANTIASIIPIYNGHGENTFTYIAQLAKLTGFAPDQPLDLDNPAVLSRLMSGMVKLESGRDMSPQEIREDMQSAVSSKSPYLRSGFETEWLMRHMHGAPSVVSRPAHVVIHNQTSARVSYSANAAAY